MGDACLHSIFPGPVHTSAAPPPRFIPRPTAGGAWHGMAWHGIIVLLLLPHPTTPAHMHARNCHTHVPLRLTGRTPRTEQAGFDVAQ
eukprot:364952-Chlamydomonas_euryale.AAC.9